MYALTKAKDLLGDPILSLFMMSVYFLLSGFTGILFGKLSDRFRNRRLFVYLGLFVLLASSITYGFINQATAWLFLPTSCLYGLGTGLLLPTTSALYSEKEPDMSHGKLVALINIATSGGWAVGLFVGGILKLFTVNLVFFILSINLVVAIILLRLGVKQVSPDPQVPERVNISQMNEEDSKMTYTRNFLIILLIFLATIVAFRHITAQGTIGSVLPHYLGELNANELERSLIMSINPIVQALFMIPMGIACDKLGRKPLLIIGAICTQCMALGYALSWNILMIIPAQIFVGVSWPALIIGSNALIVDTTTKDNRGLGFAIVNAGLSIGGTLGPMISAFLLVGSFALSGFFNYQMTFLIMSIFAQISLALTLVLREERFKGKPSRYSILRVRKL